MNFNFKTRVKNKRKTSRQFQCNTVSLSVRPYTLLCFALRTAQFSSYLLIPYPEHFLPLFSVYILSSCFLLFVPSGRFFLLNNYAAVPQSLPRVIMLLISARGLGLLF